MIDTHNHVCQFELKLEKHWVTSNCLLRIFTTILAITVSDCWKGFNYEIPQNNNGRNYNICNFADMLAYELLYNTYATTSMTREGFPSPLRRSPRK
jgi:hypothetical protein